VHFSHVTFKNLGFWVWLPSILATDDLCIFYCEFAFVILNDVRVYRCVLLIWVLYSLAVYLEFGNHVVGFLFKVDFWLVNFYVWLSWFAIVAFHRECALIITKVEADFYSFTTSRNRLRWSYRILIWLTTQLLKRLWNVHLLLDHLCCNNILWHDYWLERYFFQARNAWSWSSDFRLSSFNCKLDLSLNRLIDFVRPYPLDVFEKLSQHDS